MYGIWLHSSSQTDVFGMVMRLILKRLLVVIVGIIMFTVCDIYIPVILFIRLLVSTFTLYV